MLKGANYCITQENIAMHELIGLQAKVCSSTDSARRGIAGKVVDETKNTLIIEQNGAEKKVPKGECVFEFELGDEKVEVDGKRIAYRPEQRAKLARGNL